MQFQQLSLRLIAPRSADEDVRRREFILNIFVTAILCLLLIGLVVHSVNYILFTTPERWANDAVSFGFLFALLFFFALLLFFSRLGLVHVSAYILIGALFSLAAYMQLRWGVDVNAALLFDAIVIVMSGILIS